jgi:hypothetical protein
MLHSVVTRKLNISCVLGMTTCPPVSSIHTELALSTSPQCLSQRVYSLFPYVRGPFRRTGSGGGPAKHNVDISVRNVKHFVNTIVDD